MRLWKLHRQPRYIEAGNAGDHVWSLEEIVELADK